MVPFGPSKNDGRLDVGATVATVRYSQVGSSHDREHLDRHGRPLCVRQLASGAKRRHDLLRTGATVRRAPANELTTKTDPQDHWIRAVDTTVLSLVRSPTLNGVRCY